MSAGMSFANQREFDKGIARLSNVKNIGGEKVLIQQAKLFTRDVLKLTPPFHSKGAKGVISQSFAFQRSVGKKAVARDIYRLFQPLGKWMHENIRFSAIADKGLAKRIKSYKAKREYHKLERVLRDHGKIRGIVDEPTEQLHNSRRTRVGRVRKNEIPYLVTRASRITAYIKDKQEHVGKFKSGWVKSATATGVKVPEWINSKREPGLYRANFSGPQMFIELGNLSQFGNKTEARIMEAAVENRIRSMKKEAEHIIAAELKKQERKTGRSGIK